MEWILIGGVSLLIGDFRLHHEECLFFLYMVLLGLSLVFKIYLGFYCFFVVIVFDALSYRGT